MAQKAAESFKRAQSLREHAQVMERIIADRKLVDQIHGERLQDDYVAALADALSLVLTTLAEMEADRATEADAQAWAEDEQDMRQIEREWSQYDRDPPGS